MHLAQAADALASSEMGERHSVASDSKSDEHCNFQKFAPKKNLEEGETLCLEQQSNEPAPSMKSEDSLLIVTKEKMMLSETARETKSKVGESSKISQPNAKPTIVSSSPSSEKNEEDMIPAEMDNSKKPTSFDDVGYAVSLHKSTTKTAPDNGSAYGKHGENEENNEDDIMTPPANNSGVFTKKVEGRPSCMVLKTDEAVISSRTDSSLELFSSSKKLFKEDSEKAQVNEISYCDRSLSFKNDDKTKHPFITLKHFGKEYLVFLPSQCDDVDNSEATAHFSELLTAAFDIDPSEHILGLVAKSSNTMKSLDSDFVSNGKQLEMLIPLSSLVAGCHTNTSVLDTISFNFSLRDSKEIEFNLLLCKRKPTYRQPAEVEAKTSVTEELESECGDSYDEERSSRDGDSQHYGDMSTDLYLTIGTLIRFIKRATDKGLLKAVYERVLLQYITENCSYDGYETEVVSGVLNAAFRVAEWRQDANYFVHALSDLANAMLKEELPDFDEEGFLTISNIEVMLPTAELLFQSQHLEAEQYVALLEAILCSHPMILSVYKCYKLCLVRSYISGKDSKESDKEAPDKKTSLARIKEYEADNSSSTASHALNYLLSAMNRVGLSLKPVKQDQPFDIEDHKAFVSDSSLVAWAFDMGLHHLSSRLPQDELDLLVGLFEKGDDYLMSACRLFLLDHDIDELEHAFLTRWRLCCRQELDLYLDNNDNHSEDLNRYEYEEKCSSTKGREAIYNSNSEECDVASDSNEKLPPETSEVLIESEEWVDKIPKTLLQAVAIMVEKKQLSMDQGAALVGTYALDSNSLVHVLHEKYLMGGDSKKFLSELECLVTKPNHINATQLQKNRPRPQSAPDIDIKPKAFSTPFVDDELEETTHYTECDQSMSLYSSLFQEIDKWPGFSDLSKVTLRLAATRDDHDLRNAIKHFKNNGDAEKFRILLDRVVKKVLQEFRDE